METNISLSNFVWRNQSTFSFITNSWFLGWPDNEGQCSSTGGRKREAFDSSRGAKPHCRWRTQWTAPDTFAFGTWRLWFCPWHAPQGWGQAQSPRWSNWRTAHWQRRKQWKGKREMSRPPASCSESHKSKHIALHGSRPWNAARHSRGSAGRTSSCPSEPSSS